MIGTSKQTIVKTLDHFNLNRVGYYGFENVELDKLYGVRSRQPGGTFYYGVTGQQVLNLLTDGAITIISHYLCDSLQEFDEKYLMCNGEVLISQKYAHTPPEYSGFLSHKRGISLREAANDHDRKIITTRHAVPQHIFTELWARAIIGFVAEFSVYSQTCGNKDEHTIYWEVRKY